jgi:hypothetical protein
VKEKWKELIYVAGPYRGKCEWDVKQNIRRAEDIGAELWSWGWVPIVPHLNTNFFGGAYGIPDNVWLKGDFAILKVCHFFLATPGWGKSSGTIDEIKEATLNDKPVLFWEIDEDKEFLKHYYDLTDTSK